MSLYLIPCVLLFAFYYYAHNSQFFPERFDDEVVLSEQSYRSKPESGRELCHTSNVNVELNPSCILGDVKQSEINVILWGYSHANHFVGVVEELAIAQKLKVQDITMGNCPPIIGLYINLPEARQICINKNENAFDYITIMKPEYVILAGSWAGYNGQNLDARDNEKSLDIIQKGLIKTVNMLQSHNVKVIIFEMLPRMAQNNSQCFLKQQIFPKYHEKDSCLFENNFLKLELDKFYLNIAQQTNKEVYFINVSGLFCKNRVCQTWLDETPLYRDSNHLNLDGSHLIGKKLSDMNAHVAIF
jgi:hypothetical protein